MNGFVLVESAGFWSVVELGRSSACVGTSTTVILGGETIVGGGSMEVLDDGVAGSGG